MKRPQSLLTIVWRRILAFASLAMILQTAIVFGNYWFDNAELAQLFVEHETQFIADDFRAATARGTSFPSAMVDNRYNLKELSGSGSYLVRISDETDRILFSNCADCKEHFLPLEVDPPTFWSRTIVPGKPLTLVGGRTFPTADGGWINVEIASIGDPSHLVNRVIMNEMVDHMVWPMGLMLVFVVGATITSIRLALRPIGAVAAAADALDLRGTLKALPTARLPGEIATLVSSVNHAFKRVEEIVRSQKVFSASIAHEIRTPVSIVKLELANIDDPRARKAERDLDALTHTLQQLTALARLDSVEGEAFEVTNVAELVAEVVQEIAPLVFSKGKSLSFERFAEPTALVSRALISMLIRNLIENAIKHTQDGTAINVSVGLPASITVSDNGPGLNYATDPARTDLAIVKSTGALGIGLKIAERVATLHGGILSLSSTTKGLSAKVDLKPYQQHA